MSGWFIQEIAIEGFRGINNQGAPLELKFKTDHINSVFAPNGVGKSSIFEAVHYAVFDRIPRLDDLPQAEKGKDYYLNRFHPSATGTISLVLVPAGGGTATKITVVRDAAGVRAVKAPPGVDGEKILSELRREFILLDGRTFRDFIELKPTDRGRSFAGLLGLRPYSTLNLALQSLSNTRAFNNHFGTAGKGHAQARVEASRKSAAENLAAAYKNLVGEDLDPALKEADLLIKAHSALCGIELLKPLCSGKMFEQIDANACNEAAKNAEGGPERDRLSTLVKAQTDLFEAIGKLPSAEIMDRMVLSAQARDQALQQTQGKIFRDLYTLSEQIIASDAWLDKTHCPTCDRAGQHSVLDHVRKRLGAFEAVKDAGTKVAHEWASSNVIASAKLEGDCLADGEARLIEVADRDGSQGELTEAQANELKNRIELIRARAKVTLDEVAMERSELEKKLPAKLTIVVEKIEAARRLQTNLQVRRDADAELIELGAQIAAITRVKTFLDAASKQIADADSRAAVRRLQAIEPKFRDFFRAIMHADVVPAISKKLGSEELHISLAEFWTLKDLSAPALLSESFRNAFAISVYLAAAALYAGDARFLILDDITSSFDSGHQLLLMNVLRDQFARPGNAAGPQVIILSHDTALEKLFNTNSNAGGWYHQNIQGTPRTAVLPQSNAVTKIRDATLAHLHAGNVDDAALRIRQYLEFKLMEVISKVNIAVPMDIAFSDDKRMAGNLINSIKAEVELHHAAGKLILTPLQQTGLNAAVATIVGNYLSHWSTGQLHMFTAAALKGVMSSIEDYCRCFQFEDPPGSGFRFYKSLSRKT
ncbi:MAG: hypothetical protein C0434_06080 [Xanthomonadaceae bacterium]|nr:hypothetical protein [Xanthomonadaceae bacterium]